MDGQTPATKAETIGNVTYHYDLDQGSEAWLAARCGLLTASEMKRIFSVSTAAPCGATVKSGAACSRSAEDGFKTCRQHRAQDETAADRPAVLRITTNDKTPAHVYELLAQRINRYVEPSYIGDDMLRGMADEVDARIIYARECASVETIGFLTNSKWGFTIGYSPDGMVGARGLIECKSRVQKYQVQTVIECAATGTAPAEFMLQLQAGLLVSERDWVDFISYSGGMPMLVVRVYPDPVLQAAILTAAFDFETALRAKQQEYWAAMTGARTYPTQRRTYEDITL